MKICLVHEEYPEETDFGGIATYQKQLAKKLVHLGNEVFVVARSLDFDKNYDEDGIYVIRIGQKSMNSLEDYIKYRKRVNQILERLSNENKIDIIETPDWGAETIFFLKNPNRRIPVITKLHTPLCVWQEYNKNGLNKTINDKMLQWEKYCMENSDKIISCSQLLKNILIKKHNIKVERATVIYNVINHSEFTFQNQRKNSNTVLYCGSIEQRKGVLLLAEVIRDIFLEKIDFNAQFVFVGNDTYRNDKGISTVEYIKQIVPKEYHNKLTFLGQKPYEQLNEIMNQSRIGIVPSLFDNFPYVAIEEMCTELPVIISDNIGIKEILSNEQLCFKSNDKDDLKKVLLSLYENNEMCAEFGREGRLSVEKELDEQILLPQMLNIYKEALNEFR